MNMQTNMIWHYYNCCVNGDEKKKCLLLSTSLSLSIILDWSPGTPSLETGMIELECYNSWYITAFSLLYDDGYRRTNRNFSGQGRFLKVRALQ